MGFYSVLIPTVHTYVHMYVLFRLSKSIRSVRQMQFQSYCIFVYIIQLLLDYNMYLHQYFIVWIVFLRNDLFLHYNITYCSLKWYSALPTERTRIVEVSSNYIQIPYRGASRCLTRSNFCSCRESRWCQWCDRCAARNCRSFFSAALQSRLFRKRQNDLRVREAFITFQSNSGNHEAMAKDDGDDLLPDKDAAKGFYAKYEPKEILGRWVD